jgi:flagellar biosynthesis activator protein FlaF
MVSPGQKYTRTPQAGNPAKTEAWALLESARLLEGAKSLGSAEFLGALRRNWLLWTIFQANLVDAECTLPAEVRGNLLGLANFIDRHTAALLIKPDPNQIDVLVNINRQIGEGLLEGQRNASAKAASSGTATPPAQLRESA